MPLCKGTSFDALTARIVQSYRTLGGINHLGGPNLPDRASIEDVLGKVEALLFPGFFADEGLGARDVADQTQEKVITLYNRLRPQLEKNLAFNTRQAQPDAPMDDLALRGRADALTCAFLGEIPALRDALNADVAALLAGDPAARSQEEVILAYPGLRAVVIHRVAHHFWNAGARLIARMMAESVHAKTGIDIHPGATIGRHFYIDHGTGVVIGETTVIGDHVKIYQGVSLGALSVNKALAERKRHPTIEDHVTIYAGATILGGDTVIGHHSVIGGNVWLVNSVPPMSRVENVPGIKVAQKPKVV